MFSPKLTTIFVIDSNVPTSATSYLLKLFYWHILPNILSLNMANKIKFSKTMYS